MMGMCTRTSVSKGGEVAVLSVKSELKSLDLSLQGLEMPGSFCRTATSSRNTQWLGLGLWDPAVYASRLSDLGHKTQLLSFIAFKLMTKH